jgi:hypothetical protein
MPGTIDVIVLEDPLTYERRRGSTAMTDARVLFFKYRLYPDRATGPDPCLRSVRHWLRLAPNLRPRRFYNALAGWRY